MKLDFYDAVIKAVWFPVNPYDILKCQFFDIEKDTGNGNIIEIAGKLGF